MNVQFVLIIMYNLICRFYEKNYIFKCHLKYFMRL